MSHCLSLFILLLTISMPAYAASPVKARPLSGIGVLSIRDGGENLVIYRDPGLGRTSELPALKLPGLFSPLGQASGIRHATVLSSRPGWLRIIYDETESYGWLERRRGDEFQTWEQFLQGRTFFMVAGLRQDYYQLRRNPSPEAETVASVGREDVLRIGRIEGDWIKVRDEGDKSGWLRWRDDNSRLLIMVTAPD